MSDGAPLTVTLTGEAADIVRSLVATGEAPSAEAAVAAALRGWASHGLSDEELGRLWDEGIASGVSEIDGHEFLQRLRDQYK
jgi:Arc/MetJ-type ribon-helix-helix transcriptional regulator